MRGRSALWTQSLPLAQHPLLSTCPALFARNNGYPIRLWTVLGFVFGLWAVAVCVLLPKRGTPESN